MSTSDQNATTFQNVLDELRRVASDSADLGTRFEQLMCAYFRSEASYATQFSNVWRWSDFPHKDGFSKHDTGIDLVAENTGGAGFVAIQCKCYAEDDQFLATSSRCNEGLSR